MYVKVHISEHMYVYVHSSERMYVHVRVFKGVYPDLSPLPESPAN